MANDVAAGGRWPGEAEDLDEVEWLVLGSKRGVTRRNMARKGAEYGLGHSGYVPMGMCPKLGLPMVHNEIMLLISSNRTL